MKPQKPEKDEQEISFPTVPRGSYILKFNSGIRLIANEDTGAKSKKPFTSSRVVGTKPIKDGIFLYLPGSVFECFVAHYLF